jgi:hypothetical protein
VTGTQNGVNGLFTTARPYIANSLDVIINGLSQGPLVSETNPALGTFTIDAPLATDDVYVKYQYVASTFGNSDTVDSFHATQTPTANTILPLDSNARVKPSAIGTKFIDSDFTIAGARYTNTTNSFTDITNASMTYTAGPTNERAMLIATAMAQKSAGNEGILGLFVNGVQFGPEVYYNPGTSDWVRGIINANVPLAANQTVTIKLMGKAVGGGTFSVLTETVRWIPKITGIVAAE